MQREIDLLNNAIALIKADKHKEAADTLLSSGVETPLVLYQAAISLMWIKDYDRAEAVLKKHIAVYPSAETLDMLLTIYTERWDMGNTFSICEKILEQDPGHKRALFYFCAFIGGDKYNLKNCLLLSETSKKLINGDIEIQPYHTALVISALASCYNAARNMGNLNAALACFDKARMILPKDQRNIHPYRVFVTNVYSHAVYSDYYTEEQLSDILNEIYELNIPAHENNPKRDTVLFREIRIGFISSDLKFHPTGRFLVALFTASNPNGRIAYFCYNTRDESRDDMVTDTIKSSTRAFRVIGGLSTDEAEQVILADRLDIVFDLNAGARDDNRALIMRRLAQIQFAWIGFPHSSGARNVDYCLVDPVTDPPETAHKHYTEALAYMQKTFLCYPFAYRDHASFNLTEPPFTKNGYITFGTFQNILKYTPTIISIWARLLEKLPQARLMVVMSAAFDEVSRYGIKDIFKQSGIDLSRVDFTGQVLFYDYLQLYNKIDIVLDTYPFNGATTTCDAFFMGVPIITLTGTKHWERVGYAMLKHVGLDDLAAFTPDEYTDAAVKLANDTNRISQLKHTLRERLRNSPLSDTAAFKTEFENLMRRLYIKYCMENKNRTRTREDDELVKEIICGLSFFENLVYDERHRSVIYRAKDEVTALQLRFIGGQPDTEHTADYKKAVLLLRKTNDINNIKQITGICGNLLAACIERSDSL